IVVSQGADAVEDLVEGVLRMDLLADLPVDLVAHAEQPVAIDPMDPLGERSADAPEQTPIVAVVRSARTKERDRAPGSLAPSQRGHQHLALDRRMFVPDVARQHAEVPRGAFREREEDLRLRAPRLEAGDASARRLKELARLAERVPQRFVRL